MQTKDSVDLMNVEYADVLNLFRSLKKSENALKDKDKELTTLRSQVNQLKDSHGRFRGQLQTLESLKELTVSLQSQLTSLQQENKTLVEENKELATLNLKAEELLSSKETEEQNQARLLRNVQIEFATLKGRYEETLKAQKDLERIAHEERVSRVSVENRLNAADQNMAELSDQNKKLRRELEVSNHKLSQCDQELLHASEQLSSITKEVVNINTTKEALVHAEAEVSLLKADLGRMIHLFEFVSGSSQEFFHHWEDSKGMSYIGSDEIEEDNEYEYETEFSRYDPDFSTTGGYAHTMQRTSLPMNSTEFAHLKRIHGKDPYPMSSNLLEESEYWVPGEAAKLGVQFLASKFPNTSSSVIMDFLRNMNKIWLRRERRKVKRVKEVLGGTIEDLKRQLANLKPYKGVLAERQIRRLQSQLKTDRKKALTGRPRSRLEVATMDYPATPHNSQHSHSHASAKGSRKSYFATEDMDLPSELLGSGSVRRLCKTEHLKRAYENQDTETMRISTEKLLEASLLSLENMNFRRSSNPAVDADDGIAKFAMEAADDQEDTGLYPSASYLRGAVWLGRNLAMIVEELSEAMDQQRLRTMSDIQQIDSSHDSKNNVEQLLELRRNIHRMKIVATGGVSNACSLTDKTKTMVRNIIKGASELGPGRTADFQQFLSSLPIESALYPAIARQNQNDNQSHSAPGSPQNISRKLNESVNRSTSSPFTTRSMRLSSLLDTPLYSQGK